MHAYNILTSMFHDLPCFLCIYTIHIPSTQIYLYGLGFCLCFDSDFRVVEVGLGMEPVCVKTDMLEKYVRYVTTLTTRMGKSAKVSPCDGFSGVSVDVSTNPMCIALLCMPVEGVHL